VEVEENDEAVRVTAELPGLAPEDFSVALAGDRLTIRGEKKTSTEETSGSFYAVEHRYGAFMRALTLPCEVDADRATAQYTHGVLQLTLPKTAQAKARRVHVPIKV
jgi:HSP20 family protein